MDTPNARAVNETACHNNFSYMSRAKICFISHALSERECSGYHWPIIPTDLITLIVIL